MTRGLHSANTILRKPHKTMAPPISDFPIVKVAPSCTEAHGRTVLKRSLRPLLSISQLASAAPFHISALEPDSSYGRITIFALATLQLLWGAILLFAGFVAVSYKKQWRLQQSNMPFFTYILYNVDLYLGLANSLMIFVVCQRQRGGYDEIVTTMEKLSTNNADSGKDSAWLRNLFSKLLLIAVVHLVLLGTFEFIHSGELTKLSTTLAAQFVPDVVQVLSLMQYAYVLMFIYQHYKAINGALVTMAEVFKSDLVSCSSSLNALKQQHHQLHLLAYRVNELYGMLIVMSAISVLVGTSITCLEVYQFTKNTELFSELGIEAVLGVMWSGLYIGRIVLILYPNHLVENERDFTGLLLQNFPSMEDEQYMIELTVFSRLILHQKGSYLVCGLTYLNLNLMAEMLGALTTYLVILIQFDQSTTQ